MKNFINDLKIRHQFFLLYLVAFFLPSILIGGLSISWLYNTLEHWEYSQNEDSFKKTEFFFETTLKSVMEISDVIFVNKKIKEVLRTEFYSPMQAYYTYSNLFFLDDLLHTSKAIFNWRLYTENPTVFDNSFFVKATDDLKDEWWYKSAIEKKGAPFWIYKKDSVTQVWHLSLVRALYNYGEKIPFGVMSLNMSEANVSRELHGSLFDAFIEYDGDIVFASQNLSMRGEKFRAKIEELVQNIKAGSVGEGTGEKSIAFGKEKYGIIHNKISVLGDDSFMLVYLIPLERLNASTRRIVKFAVAILFAFMVLSSIIVLVLTTHFHGRVKKVKSGITSIIQKNFEIEKSIGGKDEFAEIYDALYETSVNIKKLIKEAYLNDLEQERLLSRQNDIRFKMLAAQINPHFLFNTLEAIRMKALDSASGDNDVPYMLKLLAKILRYNLSVREKVVPLYMEVEAVNNYLEIQSKRFGKRINYDIMIMCDANKIAILPLLIQPLIENSISHGLSEKTSGGFVYVVISHETDGGAKKNSLCIKVQDNGSGIKKEQLDKLNERIQNLSVENVSASFGLVNVAQRIRIFYGQGDYYGMKIQSTEGEGTTITLTIPLVYI